ncbi:AbrB/MazE/SpoVT family DNA-binding domain-containing protein [Clostridium sp. YIM B02551]|uniref:AbrB/MazE/SpoVT family DNA-binding domain-containing protein n=1 Tax=Clostridium sp. YIM B02551 TaxID=2910679 RepID=UPI001EEA60E1|nr:AbrB/MazE/SpoVT family DNA-binding domain-containing protein [Clostridium sp. YIM B02551]
MKSTGVVRKSDQLGRIVLPKELRKTLNLNEGDSLEIYTEGENIILKKYAPGCVFCGEVDNTTEYKGQTICKGCLKDLKGAK